MGTGELNMKFSSLTVPGSAPAGEILGAENGKERTFRISEYKGRFLVIVFYHGDWGCQEYLQAFSDLQEKFKSIKCEVVGCSTDSSKGHLVWMKSDKSDGGFGGNLKFPLWSDVSGNLSDQFDLYDAEEKQCLDGVVIIDEGGEYAEKIQGGCQGYKEIFLKIHFLLIKWSRNVSCKAGPCRDGEGLGCI